MTPLMRVIRKQFSKPYAQQTIYGDGDQIDTLLYEDTKIIDCTDCFEELTIMQQDFFEHQTDQMPELLETLQNVHASHRYVWLEYIIPSGLTPDNRVEGFTDIRRAVIISGAEPDETGFFRRTGIQVIEYSKSMGLRIPTMEQFTADKTEIQLQQLVNSHRLMLYHLHRPNMAIEAEPLDPQMEKLRGVRGGKKRNEYIVKSSVARLLIDGKLVNPRQARSENKGILPYHKVSAHYHTYNYLAGPKKIWVDTYWRGNRDVGIVSKTYKAETVT